MGLNWCCSPKKPFYGIIDPEQAAWAQARFSAHPWACFEQPLALTNQDALWAIPQTHLICTSTKDSRADSLCGNYRGAIHDIDTGHDLMLTEPDWVAARLAAVAAEMGE
jgi:hypothetical protein